VGGQIDVHVRHHGRVRRRPCRLQSTAAAFRLEVDHRDIGQLIGELVCDDQGFVGAGVIGDRDTRPVRHLVG
jgi:hypothetical protein